jgi:SprT protein
MTNLKKLNLLKKAVETKIQEISKLSDEIFGVSPTMNIVYDLESVRTLGIASYTKGTMRLNKHLLLEFGETYINEIVVHEYAHFVVRAQEARGDFGFHHPKPHGREFKYVCAYFGIPGKATTSVFSNSKFLNEKQKKLNSSRKTWVYSCNCEKPHEVSTTIHNKMRRGLVYTCKKCKSNLKFQNAA